MNARRNNKKTKNKKKKTISFDTFRFDFMFYYDILYLYIVDPAEYNNNLLSCYNNISAFLRLYHVAITPAVAFIKDMSKTDFKLAIVKSTCAIALFDFSYKYNN